jgi:hypothetical protein
MSTQGLPPRCQESEASVAEGLPSQYCLIMHQIKALCWQRPEIDPGQRFILLSTQKLLVWRNIMTKVKFPILALLVFFVAACVTPPAIEVVQSLGN